MVISDITINQFVTVFGFHRNFRCQIPFETERDDLLFMSDGAGVVDLNKVFSPLKIAGLPRIYAMILLPLVTG